MLFKNVSALILVLVSFYSVANNDNWLLPSTHFLTAKMPMVVVHPRPDIETNSWARHKKAYPNGVVEYRVPIAIQGGAFPFKYEIIESPSGMNIGATIVDADYGILTWKPTSAVNEQNVTIQITDQDQNTVSVSWLISATTDGFIFVDPNVANAGTGTINSPLKQFSDIHKNSETDSEFSGYIVYFRSGTHVLTGQATKGNLESGRNRYPVVWLGYTGEDAIIDSNSSKVLVDNRDDVFVSQLKFMNARTDVNNSHFWFFNQNAPQKRMTFFEVDFDEIRRGLKGSDNPAAVTFFNPGRLRNYFTLMGCTIDNFSAPIVDAYAVKCAVIENNKILKNNPEAVGQNQGMLLKSDLQDFSIRRNQSTLSSFNYGAIEILMQSQLFTNSGIEISYNLIIDPLYKTKNTRALVYNWQAGSGSNNNPNVYVYRNTVLGGVTGLNGFPYTIYVENNVILSSAGLNESTSNRAIFDSDNTIEASDSKIIGVNGLLTGVTSQYRGIRGHEIITGIKVPNAPELLRVQ